MLRSNVTVEVSIDMLDRSVCNDACTDDCLYECINVLCMYACV
jgi:hypothetical protein